MMTGTHASNLINYETLYFPIEPDQGHILPTTVVLVAGRIGDYAVYIGHGSPAWVAQYGNKLSFALARGFFPGIQEGEYRP